MPGADRLREVEEFLDYHRLPRLTRDKIGYLSRSLTV